MEDLTASLRALADFLDRDEFEGVRPPTCISWPGLFHQVSWFDLSVDGSKVLAVMEDRAGSFSFYGRSRGDQYFKGDLNPTAPQLPKALLDALEALKE